MTHQPQTNPRGETFSRRRRALSVALALVATAALVTLPALPAAAHDGVIESSPEAGSTVTTALDEVSIRFSDELLDLGGKGLFIIQVVGPDASFYNIGCVTVVEDRASTAVVLGGSGTYTVQWQVISSDGHPTSDSFTFDFQQPAGFTAAAGAVVSPCMPGESASDEGTTGEDDLSASETTRIQTQIFVAGGIIVFLLLAAAGALALIGRRKRKLES